ncbi:GIY-YIG nuclease family protein [Streptomyces sp. JS01]|uniref:GIY-YIG nuclease family protein n=1 Tax=Streptomyces sp. JS01 TaxID=1525753 RepID=UPI00067DE6DF|nr:GIY-YIG nuclease family protein [Streptomyces sp. JS01]
MSTPRCTEQPPPRALPDRKKTPGGSGRTALYRLYGTDDRLLYVGITTNPKKRWHAHSRDKYWWPEVTHKSIEWFETRKSAERIEKIEITEEQPIYNRNHNGDRRRQLQCEDNRRAKQLLPKPPPTPATPAPLSIYPPFPQ